MKGYNFNRAANGAYSDSNEVIDNNPDDRTVEFELPSNRCVYGDMEGVPFLFISGPNQDQYDGYEDVIGLYMEYYNHYTSVGIKMGTDDDPNNRQYTIEYYDGNGRIGTHYADPPEETASGTAMGVKHQGTSHNAYQAENRQGIDESRQDGEYFYEYSSSGDPIWSGPDEGEWNASEVLVVTPSAQPPTRWPNGSITETTLDATVNPDVPDRMCGGDRATVEIEMSNDHVASDIIGQVNYEALGTGGGVIDFNIGPGGSKSVYIEATIPDNAIPTEQEIISIDVTSDADNRANPSASFSTIVGTQPDEVAIDQVQVPTEAVAGRDIEGSVEVSNTGNCSADVTVSLNEQ